MAENKSNKKNIDIESETEIVKSLYGKRIRKKGHYLGGEELYKETMKILNSLVHK